MPGSEPLWPRSRVQQFPCTALGAKLQLSWLLASGAARALPTSLLPLAASFGSWHSMQSMGPLQTYACMQAAASLLPPRLTCAALPYSPTECAVSWGAA